MATTYFTDEDAPFLKPYVPFPPKLHDTLIWIVSIANVILQSGSTVPEWISKLPKPSKMKRRAMGKVRRGDGVTKDEIIGKREALKKRYVIFACARRKRLISGSTCTEK